MFHARDRLYHTTTKSFLVVECKKCRLIRLEPRPCPEELAGYYPSNYWYAPRSAGQTLEQIYRRFVLHDHVSFVWQALKDIGEIGLVLDVGCGGGLFLNLLRERGVPVLGMETSQDAASVAWKSSHVAVIRGDLASSPVVRGSCSAITMFHVLEHLYDPVSYIKSARDLLVPNGRLIVQVPNAASWQFLLLGEYWNGIDVPRHLVNYRRKDIENLLEFCGFEIVRRKHFSLRDNPAGLASSLAPALDPMVRRVRGITDPPYLKLLKDILYLGLTVAALPFTIAEAAAGAGSTIMLEARKKP